MTAVTIGDKVISPSHIRQIEKEDYFGKFSIRIYWLGTTYGFDTWTYDTQCTRDKIFDEIKSAIAKAS